MCEAILAANLTPDAYRIVDDVTAPTPVLLDTCDVGVAIEPSMCVSDAVVRGLPSIVIRHPAHPFDYPAPFAWKDFEQVCHRVEDEGDLRDALVALTRDGEARARLLHHRRAYVERFLFAADGGSSARVAAIVEHLAAGEPPETFVAAVGEPRL